MNFENSQKNVMHIIENKKLKKKLISNIKKNKKIKILKKSIKEIETKKTSITFDKKKQFYDMIFLCVGKNYRIVEKLVGKRFIREDKNEKAFTCIVKHDSKITVSKQYFLKEGPMAILPINSKKFSLASEMFLSMICGEVLDEFLTLPAYKHI